MFKSIMKYVGKMVFSLGMLVVIMGVLGNYLSSLL